MTKSEKSLTGVAVGRVNPLTKPGAEHRLMDVIIGKWINQGQTIENEGIPSVKIVTSDVYEWMPGGFFVLHTAYGRIGSMDVGGTEILSYDAESHSYHSFFFDSQGNINTDELTLQGDTWIWQGEIHRATAVFTEDGKTQTVQHERLDGHGNWVAAMDITLVKVG